QARVVERMLAGTVAGFIIEAFFRPGHGREMKRASLCKIAGFHFQRIGPEPAVAGFLVAGGKKRVLVAEKPPHLVRERLRQQNRHGTNSVLVDIMQVEGGETVKKIIVYAIVIVLLFGELEAEKVASHGSDVNLCALLQTKLSAVTLKLLYYPTSQSITFPNELKSRLSDG